MFIILLAQFNSFYNAVLVLLAVVLSTAGVLIGMLVMDQAFSIIMTGTGIVALAGIVVNNNIVLIDTYQEYARYMPRIEAIIRTAEDRIRPVLLTTITTMAGLAPMMFGLSARLLRRRLLDRQPDRALVEAAGHGGGLRPRHRDGADAGLHARRCWRCGSGSRPTPLAGSRGCWRAVAAAAAAAPRATWRCDRAARARPAARDHLGRRCARRRRRTPHLRHAPAAAT